MDDGVQAQREQDLTPHLSESLPDPETGGVTKLAAGELGSRQLPGELQLHRLIAVCMYVCMYVCLVTRDFSGN